MLWTTTKKSFMGVDILYIGTLTIFHMANEIPDIPKAHGWNQALDECSDGNCALHALQLSAKYRPSALQLRSWWVETALGHPGPQIPKFC